MLRSLVLVTLLLSIPLRTFGGLIGIDAGGGIQVEPKLYDIDAVTGVGTLIGAVNDGFVAGQGFLFDDTFSLARNSTGEFYSIARSYTGLAGVEPMLIQISPSTGVGTFVTKLDANIFPATNNVRALAFAPDDTLFGIARRTAPSGNSVSDALYKLDLATGDETLIGFTGIASLDALTFGPNGVLYGWQNGTSGFLGVTQGRGLVTIDTSTAQVVDVNGLLDANGQSENQIRSITFNGQGQLFGSGLSLFNIDTSSGSANAIGPIGIGRYNFIEGLEATGLESTDMSTVPEPSSLAVFATGMLGLLGYRWRRTWKQDRISAART